MGGEAFAAMALWQASPDDIGYREDFLERVGELRGLDGRHERLPPLLLACVVQVCTIVAQNTVN